MSGLRQAVRVNSPVVAQQLVVSPKMKAFVYYRELAGLAKGLLEQSDSADLSRFLAVVAGDFEDIADGLEAGFIEELRFSVPA